MDPKSKEFKDLQAKWDAKLKKSGFEDAERRDGCLKFYDSSYFTSVSRGISVDPTWFKSKEEYHRLAGHFLYDYKFDSQEERLIWEQHANGESIRDIVKIMKEKGFKAYKSKINGIVKRLVEEMKKFRGTGT